MNADANATAAAKSPRKPREPGKPRAPGGGRRPLPENQKKVRIWGYVSPGCAKWLEALGGNTYAGASQTLERAFADHQASASGSTG